MEVEPDRDRQLRPSKGDSQPSVLRDIYVKPLSTICVMFAHASVASCKCKVELYSHAYMCVVGNNSLAIHDHNRLVNDYSYDRKMDTEVLRQLMSQ